MTKKKNKTKEPLFHIVKRSEISVKQGVLIRTIAILAALIVCSVLIAILTKKSPLVFYGEMINGVFGTSRKIWNLLQGMAIMLCISLAVTPAFKMRFWNIGAEGQVLVGGLSTCTVMFYLGGKIPTPLLFILMTVVSIAAGMIWALIPAFFKAYWNTNETLFTLMMNYIAIQLVEFAITCWVTSGSGVLSPMPNYGFPNIGPNKYFLNVLIVGIITVIAYIYLKYSKQGYEISVVGESQNTARYIGINVKKVIMRTVAISGAVCGIAGLLLVGGTNYTVSADTAGGRGFTAIMVSWLAKFNPIYMVLTTFLIIFLERGSKAVSSAFKINESISDIVTAIILIFIISCEFFVNYKIVFNSTRKEEK